MHTWDPTLTGLVGWTGKVSWRAGGHSSPLAGPGKHRSIWEGGCYQNTLQTSNTIIGMCEVQVEDKAPACPIKEKKRLPVALLLHSLELKGRGFWRQFEEVFAKANVRLGEFHHLVSWTNKSWLWSLERHFLHSAFKFWQIWPPRSTKETIQMLASHMSCKNMLTLFFGELRGIRDRWERTAIFNVWSRSGTF